MQQAADTVPLLLSTGDAQRLLRWHDPQIPFSGHCGSLSLEASSPHISKGTPELPHGQVSHPGPGFQEASVTKQTFLNVLESFAPLQTVILIQCGECCPSILPLVNSSKSMGCNPPEPRSLLDPPLPHAVIGRQIPENKMYITFSRV